MTNLQDVPAQLLPPIQVRPPAQQVTLMGGQPGAKHRARKSGGPRTRMGGPVPTRLSRTHHAVRRGPSPETGSPGSATVPRAHGGDA